MFDTNGQLYFPAVGINPEHPFWVPEFFGNVIMVNGNTWPYLNVEQRRYRFRFLNGCDARVLILDFNDIPGVQVWQIGNEVGGANYDDTLLAFAQAGADLTPLHFTADGRFPLGDPNFTLTDGIVSKDKADGETSWASIDYVIEHTALINPGVPDTNCNGVDENCSGAADAGARHAGVDAAACGPEFPPYSHPPVRIQRRRRLGVRRIDARQRPHGLPAQRNRKRRG
jgi:hypothetical protein